MRFALACLLLAAACSNNDGPIAIADFAQFAQHAICEHDAGCGLVKESDCETQDLARIYARVVDKTDPIAYAAKIAINGKDPEITAQVTAGTLVYSASKARACVDAVESLGCDTTAHARHTVPAACYGVFVLAGADPAQCQRDVECTSGECICGLDVQTTQDCCPNTQCVPGPALPAKIGDACDQDSRTCGDGYCSNNGAVCMPNTATSGQPCEPGQCADGLACVTGTCKALPALGEACPDMLCRDEGDTCVDGTCQPVRFPRNPCMQDTDCSRYYACDLGIDQCSDLPMIGGDCTNADCPAGSYCNNQGLGTSTCMVYTADNAPCMNGFECASGQCQTTCLPLAACE